MTPELAQARWIEKHYDEKLRITEKNIEKLFDRYDRTVPREYFEARHKTLEGEIDALKTAKSKLDGKAEEIDKKAPRTSVYISYVLSGIVIILEIIKVIFR